jgi:hypothetical protein
MERVRRIGGFSPGQDPTTLARWHKEHLESILYRQITKNSGG